MFISAARTQKAPAAIQNAPEKPMSSRNGIDTNWVNTSARMRPQRSASSGERPSTASPRRRAPRTLTATYRSMAPSDLSLATAAGMPARPMSRKAETKWLG